MVVDPEIVHHAIEERIGGILALADEVERRVEVARIDRDGGVARDGETIDVERGGVAGQCDGDVNPLAGRQC